MTSGGSIAEEVDAFAERRGGGMDDEAGAVKLLGSGKVLPPRCIGTDAGMLLATGATEPGTASGGTARFFGGGLRGRTGA